jgi:ribosomal protein S18 acetylase RimI-like enzyme
VPFRLREFTPDDFERLHEVDLACFPPGISYSRRELDWYINLRGSFTLVAETSAKLPQIAGFLVGQKKPRGLGHVITIDVPVPFRRHGLGSLLMNAAEDRLKSLGCHSIVLEAAVDNLAAISFYKRLGYFVLRTIPRYYQGNLDALMMAKRLAEKPVGA